MNRRGFLKLLPLLPVAAKAVALAAEAPVIFAASRVGKSIAPGNCMAFSTLAEQSAHLQRAYGDAIVRWSNERSALYDLLRKEAPCPT